MKRIDIQHRQALSFFGITQELSNKICSKTDQGICINAFANDDNIIGDYEEYDKFETGIGQLNVVPYPDAKVTA